MNLIFEYSVLEKIRLDCKVYLSPHTHAPFTYIASFKNYTEEKITF